MFTKYTVSHLTHEFSHKALESSKVVSCSRMEASISRSRRGNLLCRAWGRERGSLCDFPLRLCNGMMSALLALLLESFAWKILSNVVCEPPGLGIDTILRRACSRTFMPFYHQVRHSDIFPDIQQSICAS